MEVLFLLILSAILFLVLYKFKEERHLIRSYFKGKYSGFTQYHPIPNDVELDELMLTHFAFYHVLSDLDKLQFRIKLNAITNDLRKHRIRFIKHMKRTLA